MGTLVLNLAVNTSAVLCAAYLLKGVYIHNVATALVVAIVLGIANILLKPLLVLLTLPVTLLTLGLFIFVIDALLVLLVGTVVPGFEVTGFGWALLFSLILSLVASFLHSLTRPSRA